MSVDLPVDKVGDVAVSNSVGVGSVEKSGIVPISSTELSTGFEPLSGVKSGLSTESTALTTTTRDKDREEPQKPHVDKPGI
jgi:hypothetical protein